MWFFMRKNPGTWGYFTRFGTPLRLMLINIGGSGLCMTGWPRQWLPSFPKWECHEDTLRLFSLKWYHIAFESWVRCMHHPEHSWFELLKSCWLVGYVYVELIDYWEWLWLFIIVFFLIIIIWYLLIFYHKFILAILYRVVSVCDDFELSFVMILEGDSFCWNRQDNMIMLEFIFGRVVFCYQNLP